MVRKKDPLWEHAEKLDGLFKCNYCTMEYSGGISRIKSHLSGVKGRDIEICTKVPNEFQASTYLVIGGLNKKGKTIHDSELGPSYKLPSYSTLRTKLIPDSRTEVDSYVSNVKKSWVGSGCTLMSDIWTDLKQRAFINIVAYSPTRAVFLKSFDVSPEKKTGLFLRDIMSSVIDEIGADYVVQFVTDNASNFESVGDMLIGKFMRMYKTNCVAHGVQLLLKDIYDQVPWVQKNFNNAKAIVAYMYKHTIITAQMREFTNRELKKSCATRFTSNFQMLQSIVDVEDGLQALVASPAWRAMDYNKKEIAKNIVNIIQDSQFWLEAKEVLDTHEPLIRVLRLVDGEGSTSWYIYEAMEKAKVAIRLRCKNNEFKYLQIWKLFEEIRSKNMQFILYEFGGTIVVIVPLNYKNMQFLSG